MFAHLFNAYSKKFNTKYKRTGKLFEERFDRKPVNNLSYFKTLVCYIHLNPISHRISRHILEYPWTSYFTVLSTKPTKLYRKEIINRFDNLDNFKTFHQEKHDFDNIKQFIF